MFALSSDFDNSPNVVLEAMASGLPVVATDVGGVREFVQTMHGGAVVPTGDAGGAGAARIERYSRGPPARAAGGATTVARAAADSRGARARSSCSTSTDVRSTARRPRRARVGMKVAIRDDDTCYFTAPDALERVYDDVWDRVPVCLATVPFAIGYERAGIPRGALALGRIVSARAEPRSGDVSAKS